MDPASLVVAVVQLAAAIYHQVETVRGNKPLWDEIAGLIRQTVQLIQGLTTLPSQANFFTALSNMYNKMYEIERFLNDIARKKFLEHFFKAHTYRARLLGYRQAIYEQSLVLTAAFQAQSLMDAQRDREFAYYQAEIARQRAIQQDELSRQQAENARKQSEDLARIEALLRNQEAVKKQSMDSEILLRKQMESAQRCLDVSRAYYTMPKGVDEIPLYSVECEQKIQSSRVGDVYRGTWDGKPVFAKVIFDRVSAQDRQHFAREMETLTTLKHPNIVRMYGGSIEESSMCIVTEQTSFLTDVFENYSTDVEKRMRILRDLLAGLRYMHSKQVMHANIKPEEVGIGCYGEAQWIDLSWIKTDVLSLQSIGGIQESNLWQAPEVRGNRQAVTPASDVYSFGWMIWTLYMGRLPFSDRVNFNWTQCLRLNTQEAIPENCPYGDIIRRCWSIDPRERPSLNDVAQALERPASLSGEEYFLRAKEIEQRTGSADQAIEYYNSSVEKGYYKAMTRLGCFYLGDGKIKPPLERLVKAKKYFEDAIALGDHHLAYFNLGLMYEKNWIASGNSVLDALEAYQSAKDKCEVGTQSYLLYSHRIKKLASAPPEGQSPRLPQIKG